MRPEDQNAWGNAMQEKTSRLSGAKAIGQTSEKEATETGSAAGNMGVGNSPFTSAVQNAKEAEAGNGFLNNVQGKSLEQAATAAMPGGKMVAGQVKKFGPFGIVLIIMMIIMGAFAGVQSLAPFALIANGLDQFNNLRTSMNRRSTYFMRFSMDRTRNHPITKRAKIFGAEKFKISKSQAKKLKKQNVFYVDSDEFKCRFLVYEDADTGKKYAIAANDGDVEKLPHSAEIDLDGSGKKVKIDFSERMKLDDALAGSDNFSRSIDVGTRTMKGHVAGWFDDLSDKLHGRIGSSRNKFKDVSDTASEEEIKKKALPGGGDQGMDETIKKTQDNDAQEYDGEDEVKDKNGKTELDDKGNPKKQKRKVLADTGDDSIKKGASQKEVELALSGKAKAIAAAMGGASSTYCTVMKAYQMFTAMVSGIMVANILNYITGFFEAVQKTQIGDGGKTELSYYMTGLSTKGKTTDKDGNVVAGKENTASLESPAWNQFFASGDLTVDPKNDKVAEKFNRDEALNVAMSEAPGAIQKMEGVAAATMSGRVAYQTCLSTQMISSGVDFVATVVLAATTFGVGAMIKDAMKNILEKAVVMGIQATIMMAFTSMLPYFAQWMAKDLISNMAGEDAAYAINSGFNIYSGRQMQMSSGLPATEAKLMAHWREQQEVIAEEGALERSLKSPFDPTSKYTFVGSIANSLMPVASTFNSPLMTVSKTMDTVGSALAGLMPTARADGMTKFETSLNKNCPTLSSIGLVGDAFCNPYFVTDFSTMAEDPAEVFNKVAEKDARNFDFDSGDDNPKIKPDSELGRWVVSCAVRDSQFGQVDGNVMNAIAGLVNTGSGALDTAVNSGLQMVPFVNSVADFAAAAKEQANFNWATGQNCVSDEYKYYSRYSEDQRMMESAGIIEKSAVARFLEEYEKKNPVDNSREGVIARYSGWTKEDVVTVFDAIRYVEWLAEYKPDNYGPIVSSLKSDEGDKFEFNNLTLSIYENLAIERIIYQDLRARTLVI